MLDLSGCAPSGPTPPATTAATADGSAPTTAAPAAPTVPGSAPSASTVTGTDVLLALDPAGPATTADTEATVREALAGLDWRWLRPGDSVFVKPASNSPHPHPSVTSAAAVRAVVAELVERGAGRVLVGDQAGVSYVRRTATGATFGSTRRCFASNGLLDAVDASGAELHFFDEQDFHDGFFEATPPPGSHWTRPLALPGVIHDVDHVVYLPRVSAHAIAGYTAGHKSAIGWLRDDSRNHLHTDAASFYEKYTEVNYVPELRERLRLAIVVAEQFLLHFGPDTGGTVVTADPRLVLASADLASLDAVLGGLLVHLNASTTPAPGVHPYSAASADAINRGFTLQAVAAQTGIPWGSSAADYTALVPHTFERGISGDRALARAWEIVGGRPSSIRVVTTGTAPAAALVDAVTRHGEGTISFT